VRPGHPRTVGRASLVAALASIAIAACAAPVPFTPAAGSAGPSGAPSPSAGPSTAVPTSAASGAAPSASDVAGASQTLPPTAAPTPAPTKPASSTTPRPTRTPAPTPARTPAPTPASTPAGWDPARVSVAFSSVATVPGRPLAIANAGDGSNRLFVAEQGGRVYTIDGGTVGSAPFLDISAKVSGGGEQGLLGLAFHPDFPSDNRVFVDYTDTNGDTVVASFAVPAGTPDAVDPGTEVVILTVSQPYANHNGGAIAFGPDGYLYIALGDGGSGGDPQNNAQFLGTLLGKILRIDVDRSSGGKAYAIPASNPFVGTSGARGEIWLYGLRNPFRFSFDRATGDLWIGDVGQNKWEEVDVARAGVGGLNFGWRIMEGDHCYNPSSGCPTAGLTLPVVEYDHSLGCAVIGGNVYRGSAYPVLRGGYLFTDECSGRTWAVSAAAKGAQALVQVGAAPGGIAGYGESESGELYAANLSGTVYRVSATAR
jgi:glucose/arabinose dehydrogenase